MTGPELAKSLAPMVGVAGRQQLRPLHTGEKVVQFAYDDIRDWDVLGKFIDNNEDALDLHDGQNGFSLTIRGTAGG